MMKIKNITMYDIVWIVCIWLQLYILLEVTSRGLGLELLIVSDFPQENAKFSHLWADNE